MYRSDATPSASPGGRARAFCEPVSTKSISHSSNWSGVAPSPVTLSTRESTPRAREMSLIRRTSVRAPVDVSECTTVSAAYDSDASLRSTSSGSATRPSATSMTSVSRPQARAMLAKRSENDPFTIASTRPGGAQRTEASISPVADELLTSTGRRVLKRSWSPLCSRANSRSNSAPRCGIIGRSIASRTSLRTSVGPGRKKLPKGGGDAGCAVTRARAPGGL
jgi:hypothetical protein